MSDSKKLDLILAELRGVKGDVEGLKGDMQDMKSEMQVMKSDMQDMKSEMQVMKSDMQDMKSEMQVMKGDMQDMKSEMQDMKSDIKVLKNDVKRLDDKIAGRNVHLETVTDRNITFIAEGHLDLSRKLDEALKSEQLKELYFIRTNMIDDEVRKIKERLAETA